MIELSSPAISQKCSLAVLLVGFAFLATVSVMNALMFEGLFVESVNWIYEYQTAYPQESIQMIHKIVSLCYGPIGTGTILGSYLVLTKRKLRTLVHIDYFFYCTFMMALMKQTLQETRPIWYDTRIHQWDWFCPVDAGNPSGHTMAVILLNEPIVSDTIGYSKYRILAFPMGLLAALLAVSRLYLGAHSGDQVLMGLVLGFLFLALFKFIFQPALYKLLWGLFTGRKQLKTLKFSILFILNLATIALPIMVFYVNAATQPFSQKTLFQIKEVCKVIVSNEQAQTSLMKSCAIGCSAFGIIFGFALLPKTITNKKYFLGQWNYQQKSDFFLNIGVYLICLSVPFGLKILFEAVVVAPLLQYLLFCFVIQLAAFNLTFFAPLLANKLKIHEYLSSTQEQEDNKYYDQEVFENKRNLIKHEIKS